MNIGAVKSSCNTCETNGQKSFKTIKEDFKSLERALKSGDLKAAQDAFAKLKQDLPSTQKSTLKSTATAPAQQATTDLDAIGSALQAGDLTGAQKAFTTFVQDLQASRKTHGHHHDHDSDGDTDSATSSPPTAQTPGLTANGLNVQA